MKSTGLQHFYLALSFLTRIPTPHISRLDPADIGRSALYYPVVGVVLGVLLCILPWLLPAASPVLLAAVLTVLWAMLTGGLHLDGVADGADAWLGGWGDEEKTHRILKDSLVGAAGVIAVVAVMLLKFAALTVLLEQQLWWSVLFAPVLGRASVLLLFLTTPYVRRNGLGNAITDFLPPHFAWVITVFVLGVGFFLSLPGVLVFLLVFYLLRRLMLQRLLGCTGDTAGAGIEVSEVCWMLGIGLAL